MTIRFQMLILFNAIKSINEMHTSNFLESLQTQYYYTAHTAIPGRHGSDMVHMRSIMK